MAQHSNLRSQLIQSKHFPYFNSMGKDNYIDLESNGVPTPASLYPPGPMREKHKLSWSDLGFKTNGKKSKTILFEQNGTIYSGEMMAVLGPSGAGKSTFLDVISKKAKGSPGTIISFNDDPKFDMRELAQYVEQDDALIGVLSVRETIEFAAKLRYVTTKRIDSLPTNITRGELLKRVDVTMKSLGISEIANNRIGTPIQRGISGGQKRRVTIACAVVSHPRILFLDEPTSGLDSQTSQEVMQSIKQLAVEQGIIVLCTIHQPKWEIFQMFDQCLLLASGKTMYQAPTIELINYFDYLGKPCPAYTNPADHAISLVNTDFSNKNPGFDSEKYLTGLSQKWKSYSRNGSGSTAELKDDYTDMKTPRTPAESLFTNKSNSPSTMIMRSRTSDFYNWCYKVTVLCHRSQLNSQRNLLAYTARMAMYIMMGLLIATVWLHLGTSSDKINERLSIHSFGVTFIAFMSVSGIPSFLEERMVYVRERANGLYGPSAFLISSTLITIPFVFVCCSLFLLIVYWAVDLKPGADTWFRFLAYYFLTSFVAECQSVLIAALIPDNVAAISLGSFINGFWMCVQGYFIRTPNLPKFYYYFVHWISFQTYGFVLNTKNDLEDVLFSCTQSSEGQCQCSYPSSLQQKGICALPGEDILEYLEIKDKNKILFAFAMLIIAVVYRLLFYLVIRMTKK
ncbi:P-loop containing nucleoside triphosphate hydrolase protein [Wallemia mellicola]|uniref:P-loop containing nucleoside triphosphate hydrolase protein n=1 Tax=Wallemia mellicola TaxID=1708541 RepID=A0AB38MSB3_9BASI|nr:P-loop containing nucleoside triphosphate hydrolase protein [Wallemia mellicola]